MAAFDFDQEYASNFAYSVIKEFPVQLIGQQLSVEGLFMGPLYFYYLVPFFALFNLHPFGGFVGSVILGLTTVVAYFIIGKKMFGTKAGIVLAGLKATLFHQVRNDWTMAPSYSSELIVLITWYCFYRYWKGETKILPLMGLSFGLFTSFHPILFPFYFVFIGLLIIKKRLPSFKIAILSLVAFAIPITPLLLFEYFHKFLEVKRLLSFFGTNTSPFKIDTLLQNLQITYFGLGELLSFYTIPKELFASVFFASLLMLIFKKSQFSKESFHKYALIISFLAFLLYYTFFPSHIPEYYFLGLTTLFFLYFGAMLSLLVRNRWPFVALLLVLGNITYSNVSLFVDRWQNPSLTTLAYKDFVVKEITYRETNNNEFYVSYIKNPGWDYGFNYLFKLYGQDIEGRIAKDRVYTIVTPKSLSPDSLDIMYGNVGLILPD
ncbi:MAG: hypothetical protein UT38_C0025G0003 [Microgenomates group bacterium GW2011_GWA2_39_19]|nr:MAG: hypothetical protein UT38_C0025G0003 [Microgenomates group bacterium GW2011_GWA2_39_19]